MGKKYRKLRTIILHLLFWVVVWFFYRYFFSYNSDDMAYVTWFSTFMLPLTMAATYVMTYILIPKYLLVKDYKQFARYSFYLLVILSYLIMLILYGFLIFFLDMRINLMPPLSKNFTFILILVLLVVGAVSSITILNQNFRTISRNKELQNKILATQLELKEQELHYLKSQIHPHFLFNTLNTIYGMAIKQSEQTPELILRLSNLLDYILYQVSKPRVSLKEEVMHIDEYIELERIRFKDTLKVKLRSDEIDDSIEIAPMLLIPFVENAFKHGTIVEGFLEIDIRIIIIGDELLFRISNTTDPQSEKVKGGIGLENIRKRLDLHYQGNYELKHTLDKNIFKVEFKINNLRKLKDD
jgi:sensor histidine kinase YesM